MSDSTRGSKVTQGDVFRIKKPQLTMEGEHKCKKCGTEYVLATRQGHGLFGGRLHAQLIEKNRPSQVAMPLAQPQFIAAPQAAGGKFCHNCGKPAADACAKFCNGCGTQLG